eukprot:SAG31_NODE_2308_length_5966_cov_3.586330_5_plen_400_part_01
MKESPVESSIPIETSTNESPKRTHSSGSGGSVLADSDSIATDDENEVVCRICRMEGDDDWPLFYPCKCSGSIKYVHQDCLQTWMEHSNIRKCELCKHPFQFTPIYSDDAPSVLPSHEFLVGAIKKGAYSAHFISRLSLVLFVWLVFIPVGTCWICRLLMSRNFDVAIAAGIGSVNLSSLAADCIFGSFLSVAIVLMFLGIASIRDFVRNNPPAARMQPNMEHNDAAQEQQQPEVLARQNGHEVHEDHDNQDDPDAHDSDDNQDSRNAIDLSTQHQPMLSEHPPGGGSDPESFESPDTVFEAQLNDGVEAVARGDHEGAVKCFSNCLQLRPEDAACAYNLTCCYALMSDTGSALQWFRKAVDWGLAGLPDLNLDPARDSDLRNLMEDKNFLQLVDELKEKQ